MVAPDVPASISFLRALWPDGPWLVHEIDPNVEKPAPHSREFTDASALAIYLRERANVVNLYFTPNPSIPNIHAGFRTNPRKEHITHVTCVFADLDLPKGTPPSDGAFASLLDKVHALTPPPTIIVFSGGGYQPIWMFPDPVPTDSTVLERAEAVGRAIARDLRSDAVQNVNRLLRLPGTVNVPNALKQSRGRVPTLARVVEADWSRTWSESDPVPHLPDDYYVDEPPERDASPDRHDPNDLPTKWRRLAESGDASDYGNDRSRLTFAFIFALVKRGWADGDIVPYLTDERWGISAHCCSQPNPVRVAQRQVERARATLVEAWDTTARGVRDFASPKNIRRALREMGARLTYDSFAGRTFVNGVGPLRPIDDAVVSEILMTAHDRFGFVPSERVLSHVVSTLARSASYHPVCDYLRGLTWDGVPRLEGWLVDLAGADDTPFVRAVSKLILVAAVRRVRQPGCKFDEILVLISERQGTNKSTALSVMAVDRDWFTDDLPIHADAKKVIEQTRGKWIIECAELTGIRQGEVEAVKTLLSRSVDESRMAYGHFTEPVPRQWVPFGSTNLTTFLRDTANRRFWPVFIKQFDLGLLRALRDQLWAEAAHVESTIPSIHLDESLWEVAAAQQELVRYGDPWTDALHEHFGALTGRVASNDVWKLLGKPVHQRGGQDGGRLTQIMREMGWERDLVRVDGVVTRSFVKGTDRERAHTVYVHLDDPVLRTYRATHSESPTTDDNQDF